MFNTDMNKTISKFTGYTPTVSTLGSVDIPYINPNTTYDNSVAVYPNNWITNAIAKISPNIYNRYPNAIQGLNQDYAQVTTPIKQFGNSMGVAWNDMDGKQKFDTIGGALQGLANLYYGHQQIQNAKDILNFNKQAWQKDFDARSKAFNSQIEDRQARRVRTAANEVNANAETSVSDYMSKYGVK